MDSAINPKPKTRYRSKNLNGVGEAFLIATACSQAPEGQADWTLRLLAEQLVGKIKGNQVVSQLDPQ